MAYQNIFKRYELKYIVTSEQKKMLLDVMAPYMEPDEYGRNTICNLYFDTPDHTLVRRSLEKPVYKEKLRLRSYGTAAEESMVFLELKKKYDGVVYKRRVGAGYREAMDYLGGAGKLGKQNQIVAEIDYFKKCYPGLSAAVYLSYEREAFYGVQDRELRITFDENILWRREGLSLCEEPGGEALLSPGLTLMEVKTATAMPLWLCRSLSENAIFKTGFSKYGFAYERIRQLQETAGTAETIEAKETAGTAETIEAKEAAEKTEEIWGGKKYA